MMVIGFTVSPGQPTSIADDAEYVTLFGSDQDAANLINQKEIHWGVSQQQKQTHFIFSFCTLYFISVI